MCEDREELEHPVVKKPYNYDYEVKRKYSLEKLYMRTKQQNDKEKHIIDYIKKLDQKIKKLDKEEKNLEKILNDDKNGSLLRRQDDADPKKGEKKENFAGAYLRSQRMLAPIPVSEKVQQQIDIILGELEIIPNKITSTESTIDLYDEIRKEILKMLSLHKHIKKRKEDMANLDARLKDFEDFSKIAAVSSGGNVRPQNFARAPAPQHSAIPTAPQMSKQPSSQASEKPSATGAKQSKPSKSPAKETKTTGKAGSKRRKAGGGPGSKRQRNS